VTPTVTPSETVSVTPTVTPSETVSVTPSETVSVTPTVTPSETVSTTPTVTPSETVSVTPTVTPSETVSTTPTVTPSETVSVTPTVTPSETVSVTPTVTPTIPINYYRVGVCCEDVVAEISNVGITGGTANISDGFTYNGIAYEIVATFNTGSVILDSSLLTSNYCNTIVCTSNSPTPTPSVTTTPTVTPTVTPSETVSVTPTNSVTPTPSAQWIYITKMQICCDSTDTPINVPIGGTVAAPGQGLSNGDFIILEGHSYEIESVSVTPIGTVDYYTSVLGPYASCEAAVSAAVAINGTTSGCRYTFSGCCPDESLSYIEPFSIQGVNPNTTILPSYILPTTTNWGLANTNVSPDICAIKYDYNSSVTINNPRVVSDGYNLISTDACGIGRCLRCVYVVEPCSDSGNYFNLIVTSGDLLGATVGDVFNGSNINGNTTLNGGAYTVTGSCVSIVDSTTTPTLSGSILNASDVGDAITEVSSGCGSPLTCAECAKNFTLSNFNGTSQTISYTKCDNTSGSITVPSGGMGAPGQIGVADCVRMSTFTLPSGVQISTTFSYCS
jgi:hypothetical protein